MSMRLTGNGVQVTLTGKREDIDAVLAWFKENDEDAYSALNDNFNCSYEEKESDVIEYKQGYGNAEGFSRDYWGQIIHRIHEVSPSLEIDSQANWWQTVTGALFTAYIGFSNGEWYDYDELDEEWAERDNRLEELASDEKFEDFECELDENGDVIILKYTSDSKNAYIPASVSDIYGDAFDDCELLISITVSDDNKKFSSFNDMLFDKKKTCLIRCPEGKSGVCTIPDSVTVIYDNAFIDCKGINVFVVSENNKEYTSEDGCLYNKNKSTLLWCAQGKSGEYALPETVTKIDGNAFDGCINLTAISVSENNKKFTSEDGILYNNKKTEIICCPLKIEGEIKLPRKVKNIGYAFRDCTNLTAITIPDSVTEIVSYAFEGCTSLTAITIPASVTEIGGSAFDDCNNLTIRTTKGSIAEKYAEVRSIPFIAI